MDLKTPLENISNVLSGVFRLTPSNRRKLVERIGGISTHRLIAITRVLSVSSADVDVYLLLSCDQVVELIQFSCPYRLNTHWPMAKSPMLTSPFSDALTSQLPSCDQAIELTGIMYTLGANIH